MYGLVQPRAGFPCWSADAFSIFAGDNQYGDGRELLRYVPEHACAAHERANWTVRTHELKYVEAGREISEATLYDSIAWPARLIVTKEKRIRLFSNTVHSVEPIYAGSRGPARCRPVPESGSDRMVREHDEFLYLRDRDGDMTAPWLLVPITVASPNVLIQLTFQRHPRNVIRYGRCLEFNFDETAGGMAISAPFGIRPADLAVLGPAMKQEMPTWKDLAGTPCGDFLKGVRDWARRFLSFPVEIRDFYKFDRVQLHLRQQATFLDLSPNDWHSAPEHCTPIPPMLSRLVDAGADRQIAVTPAPQEPAVCVRHYRQRYVSGDSWTALIPREHWTRQTLAPLAVKNDPACQPLLQRMAAYLNDPNMTFHGDCTWDRQNVQDCFASYRACAPAAWCVDEEARQRLWQAIGGGVENLKEDQFVEKHEPLSGGRWAAQRHIWSSQYCTVDYDWYIGQLAAGVWCKWYYQGRDRAWLERVFPILERQFAHYRIYLDWGICSSWCDLTRKNRWLDGLFYASQGLVAFARLARELGRIELAEEAEYFLLLHIVCWDAANALADYALECGAQPEGPPNPQLDHKDMAVSGLMDRENFGFCLRSIAFGGNSVGIDTPEHMLAALSRPGLLARLRHWNRATLPKLRPKWNLDFTRNGAGAGPLQPHPLDISHTHFYFVYDPLIAEAMYLQAPLAELRKLVHLDDLAADMLMVYLQATHPKLMVPANVEFRGCTWDEKEKSLTACLRPLPNETPDPLVLISPAEPTEVVGAQEMEETPMPGGVNYRLCGERAIFRFSARRA
jgi:hypothetical protein